MIVLSVRPVSHHQSYRVISDPNGVSTPKHATLAKDAEINFMRAKEVLESLQEEYCTCKPEHEDNIKR